MRENPSRTGNVMRTWKATIVQNRSEPTISTACMKLHTTKTSKESKPKPKIFVILCDTIQTYTDIYRHIQTYTDHIQTIYRPYRKRSISRWCSTCFHFGLFCYQALGYIGIQKKTLNLVAVLCLSHKEHVCKSYTSQLDWINLRHRCNMTKKKVLAFANLRPMIPGGMAAWIYHAPYLLSIFKSWLPTHVASLSRQSG